MFSIGEAKTMDIMVCNVVFNNNTFSQNEFDMFLDIFCVVVVPIVRKLDIYPGISQPHHPTTKSDKT